MNSKLLSFHLTQCFKYYNNEVLQPYWGWNTVQQHCWTTSQRLVSTTGQHSQYDCQDLTSCSTWNPCKSTVQISYAYVRHDSHMAMGKNALKSCATIARATRKDFHQEKLSSHKQITHQQQWQNTGLVFAWDHDANLKCLASFVQDKNQTLCSRQMAFVSPIKVMTANISVTTANNRTHCVTDLTI